MARRRGRKPPRVTLEENCLKLQPWARLKEQQKLQQQHHSKEENETARKECRVLVRDGYGALPDYIDWVELYGQK